MHCSGSKSNYTYGRLHCTPFETIRVKQFMILFIPPKTICDRLQSLKKTVFNTVPIETIQKSVNISTVLSVSDELNAIE